MTGSSVISVDLSSMIILFLIVFFLSLYYWTVCTFDHWKRLNIPYAKPIPFFGNALPFVLKRENYTQMLTRIYDSLEGRPYGGYFEIREPVLMIRDPDLITNVLTKDFNYFYDRSVEFLFNKSNRQLNPLSTNLFTLTGDRWKRLRTRLTPFFTISKLNVMFVAIRACAVNISRQIADELSIDDGKERLTKTTAIEVKEIMTNYTIDVISACALSLNFQSDRRFLQEMQNTIPKNSFVRALLLAIDIRLLDLLRMPDFSTDVVDFFITHVKDNIRRREESTVDEKPKDFLQTMIDIKNDKITATPTNVVNNDRKETASELDIYDELDVIANTFIFFLGGYETTTSALIFCLHELANNADVQDKVRDEIKHIREECGENDLAGESIKNLKYLDSVITETLRKHAVMPTLFRVCTKDYIVPSTGHLIPKGTKLVIPQNALHMDPNIFPHPEKFNPDRFLPENKTKIGNACYMPFGEGPRICIGMRLAQLMMKVVLVEIVSNFILEPSTKTKYNIKYVNGTVISTPENGLWINVKLI